MLNINPSVGLRPPLTTTEIIMYTVKYKNGTLILTSTDVAYMFDASKVKLLEIKQAIKDNTLEYLPHTKFKKYKHLWINTPV